MPSTAEKIRAVSISLERDLAANEGWDEKVFKVSPM